MNRMCVPQQAPTGSQYRSSTGLPSTAGAGMGTQATARSSCSACSRTSLHAAAWPDLPLKPPVAEPAAGAAAACEQAWLAFPCCAALLEAPAAPVLLPAGAWASACAMLEAPVLLAELVVVIAAVVVARSSGPSSCSREDPRRLHASCTASGQRAAGSKSQARVQAPAARCEG